MPRKITTQLLQLSSWMAPTLRELGSTWVKWLNPPATAETPFEGLQTDIRIWTDDRDQAYLNEGEQGGRRFARDMLPRWRQTPWATCYELANEPRCHKPEDLIKLNAYSIGAMREATARGIRVCILNLAESNPGADAGSKDEGARASERWKLEQLAPAVRLACELGHYVGLHAYWRPDVEGPLGRWHALGRRIWDVEQWRQMGIDVGRLQVLINETGIDGGIAGHPGGRGWRSLSDRPAYVAEIVELEREARRHPWLKSLMLFIANHPGWTDFDVDEALLRELAARLRESPEVPAEPTPPVPATVSAEGVTYRVADVPGIYWSERDWSQVMLDGKPRLWLVLHDTEGPKEAAWAWWQDPDNPYRSSAHDLVDTGGVVWRCVTYDRAAHHCGGSHIPGYSGPDPNDVTIGIELEYPAAPASPPWPEEQLQAAVRHVGELCRSFGIPRERVLRHSDIDPANRCDPRNLPLEPFLDRVFRRPGRLPEDELATEPALMAEKARWWLEEEQRQCEAGNLGRADEIRLSLIRLLYRLESALKVA